MSANRRDRTTGCGQRVEILSCKASRRGEAGTGKRRAVSGYSSTDWISRWKDYWYLPKTKKAAAVLSKQLTEGALNKHYYAVLCGYPDCPEGDLVDYLRKEGNMALAVTGREPGICRCEDCRAALSHFGRDQRSFSACACRCNDRDRTVSSDPGAVRTCGISTVWRYEVWNGSVKRGDACAEISRRGIMRVFSGACPSCFREKDGIPGSAENPAFAGLRWRIEKLTENGNRNLQRG